MTSYPTLINPTQIQIGWIATDVMGSVMSSRLLFAGYFVTIYVRDPYKVVYLQSQGALLANSPTDLWSTDVIFTMLGYPSDVRVRLHLFLYFYLDLISFGIKVRLALVIKGKSMKLTPGEMRWYHKVTLESDNRETGHWRDAPLSQSFTGKCQLGTGISP
ncbi:hypothetical protein CQW23_02932 [Capsicum baccatum]|uniref:6-phosphogluconate dehydrogenase NADP-binding domain-containing protein n=1 Tax=Capsicum baccatum TaxID=33114 RepID=A0A2G2XSZ7_CAPBA|nr:hypothetical protein CQW23_02932 [Capsicum baccatum]